MSKDNKDLIAIIVTIALLFLGVYCLAVGASDALDAKEEAEALMNAGEIPAAAVKFYVGGMYILVSLVAFLVAREMTITRRYEMRIEELEKEKREGWQ